jgi:hypothetical protein
VLRKYLRLRASPRSPTLPANLGERTCYPYAFSPILSTESNSDIPSLKASIPVPSPQTKSACWGCLRKACPNLDYLCFAIFAPRKYPNLMRDVLKRTKVTCHPKTKTSQRLCFESRDARRTVLPRSLLGFQAILPCRLRPWLLRASGGTVGLVRAELRTNGKCFERRAPNIWNGPWSGSRHEVFR